MAFFQVFLKRPLSEGSTVYDARDIRFLKTGIVAWHYAPVLAVLSLLREGFVLLACISGGLLVLIYRFGLMELLAVPFCLGLFFLLFTQDIKAVYLRICGYKCVDFIYSQSLEEAYDTFIYNWGIRVSAKSQESGFFVRTFRCVVRFFKGELGKKPAKAELSPLANSSGSA